MNVQNWNFFVITHFYIVSNRVMLHGCVFRSQIYINYRRLASYAQNCIVSLAMIRFVMWYTFIGVRLTTLKLKTLFRIALFSAF